MKVSSKIKKQVSNIIINVFPYTRPTAEEVMELLDFDINEQDPADILDYIEADLETRGFESDLNFTDEELQRIQILVSMETINQNRMIGVIPKIKILEDIKHLDNIYRKLEIMREES